MDNRIRRGRPWWATSARRGTAVGLLAIVAVLLGGASAQAVPVPGPFGGEILGNPAPGPAGPAPNVLPLPPPPPAEPGFAPAPDLPGRHTFPVPEPGVVVQDGPGSAPADAPPVQVDADKPPENAGQPEESGAAEDHEPVGKLTRVDDKFLKRRGVNAHEVKGKNDLHPPSRFDIYVDQVGKMFGVQKGTDPKFGEFLGRIAR